MATIAAASQVKATVARQERTNFISGDWAAKPGPQMNSTNQRIQDSEGQWMNFEGAGNSIERRMEVRRLEETDEEAPNLLPPPRLPA